MLLLCRGNLPHQLDNPLFPLLQRREFDFKPQLILPIQLKHPRAFLDQGNHLHWVNVRLVVEDNASAFSVHVEFFDSEFLRQQFDPRDAEQGFGGFG